MKRRFRSRIEYKEQAITGELCGIGDLCARTNRDRARLRVSSVSRNVIANISYVNNNRSRTKVKRQNEIAANLLPELIIYITLMIRRHVQG